MATRVSAGIMLYRRVDSGIELLLAHPGGPYFAKKDLGDWSIVKGEVEPGEALLAVAHREFVEETGHVAPDGTPIDLESIVQKGGKVVHAWAIEGELDPTTAISNVVQLEWPPRSGRRQPFPEIDRVEWFGPDEARRRIKETQIPFIDRLLEALDRAASR